MAKTNEQKIKFALAEIKKWREDRRKMKAAVVRIDEFLTKRDEMSKEDRAKLIKLRDRLFKIHDKLAAELKKVDADDKAYKGFLKKLAEISAGGPAAKAFAALEKRQEERRKRIAALMGDGQTIEDQADELRKLILKKYREEKAR